MIISLFILFFVLMALYGKKLITPETSQNEIVAATTSTNAEDNAVKADEMHVYNSGDLQTECSSDDKIFCAVELTVKCTMDPELAGCDKSVVPSFVLGKTEEVERPSEISFKVVKIKPITNSSDISVYTESDCNALWFGLCKGTVVYSLTPKDNTWAVTNIFALEQ